MDANFSFLENWKLFLGIFFFIALFITIKFVRNKKVVTKNISAKDGSVATDGGVNAPITINNSKK